VPLDDTAKGLDGPSRLVEMVGRPQYISPPATPESVNHSIACLVTLQDLDERRKAGSGCWSGVAKSQWWLDPVTGLAVSGSLDWDTSTLKALLRVFVPLNYLVRPRIIGLRSMWITKRGYTRVSPETRCMKTYIRAFLPPGQLVPSGQKCDTVLGMRRPADFSFI
jgi:hypothetical protein